MKINKNINRLGYITFIVFFLVMYVGVSNLEKEYEIEHPSDEVSEEYILEHCPTKANTCKCVLSIASKKLSYKDYQEFKKLLVEMDVSTNQVQEFVNSHQLSFENCL